jgi:inhibitor of cysteine peptidase
MIRIAEDDNGRAVALIMGEELELSLAENRTTGYHWKLNGKAEPVCELVNDDFEAATGPPGSGGVHHWQFRAVQPGSGEIALQYRRPWGEDVAPARSYQVSIRVSA